MFLYKKGNQKGFTLIELLVVISIISFLSSIVLASLNTARAKSRDARRLQDLIQIRNALELYASDNGGLYPSNGTMGIAYSDVGCPGAGNSSSTWIPGLVPKYMSVLPQDPSHPFREIGGVGPRYGCYVYAGDGKHYVLSAWDSVENLLTKMYSVAGFREPDFNLNPISGDHQECMYDYGWNKQSGFLL